MGSTAINKSAVADYSHYRLFTLMSLLSLDAQGSSIGAKAVNGCRDVH